MESSPASSFEMGEAEFALEFLIVAFDAPAQFRSIDENFDRSVFGQGRESVFGRLALVFGPLDQQPFERLWGRELACAAPRRWPIPRADTADTRSADWPDDWRSTASPRPGNCQSCRAVRNIVAPRPPNARPSSRSPCRRRSKPRSGPASPSPA